MHFSGSSPVPSTLRPIHWPTFSFTCLRHLALPTLRLHGCLNHPLTSLLLSPGESHAPTVELKVVPITTANCPYLSYARVPEIRITTRGDLTMHSPPPTLGGFGWMIGRPLTNLVSHSLVTNSYITNTTALNLILLLLLGKQALQTSAKP